MHHTWVAMENTLQISPPPHTTANHCRAEAVAGWLYVAHECLRVTGCLYVVDVGENTVSQLTCNVRTLRPLHSTLYVHCSQSAQDVKYVF